MHATGCGKHLFVICIPHGVLFRKIIIIIIIMIIIIIIIIIIEWETLIFNHTKEGSPAHRNKKASIPPRAEPGTMQITHHKTS